MKKIKTILAKREFVLALVAVVAALIIGAVEPIYLSKRNILAIFMAITSTSFISMGMVMVLAVGELDLSVGMTMAFCGVISAKLSVAGLATPLVVLFTLLFAVVIGLLNGFMVAKIGLNSFITTLGMSSALEGLMLVIANGHSVTGISASLKAIGQGSLGDIQYPIFILIVVALIVDFFFRNSRTMRQIFYVGSNAKAAMLNGIGVARVKIGTFLASAVFSSVAGIIMTARLGSASVTLGSNSAMDAITACILGGASLNGGKGSILGAILGTLLLSMLSTALNLLSVNIYWQNFITGVILILAILFDAISVSKKRKGKGSVKI